VSAAAVPSPCSNQGRRAATNVESQNVNVEKEGKNRKRVCNNELKLWLEIGGEAGDDEEERRKKSRLIN
jgi:hypothetical protein